jgi:hypothetical protein
MVGEHAGIRVDLLPLNKPACEISTAAGHSSLDDPLTAIIGAFPYIGLDRTHNVLVYPCSLEVVSRLR